MEIVIAIAVFTILSTAALSAVILSAERTNAALRRSKVLADAENLLELTKASDFAAALDVFTGGAFRVSGDEKNPVYSVYIREELPEAVRCFQALPHGARGDTLHEFTVSLNHQGETLDGYDVWFVRIEARPYTCGADGRFEPDTDRQGNEVIDYETGTVIVSPQPAGAAEEGAG